MRMCQRGVCVCVCVFNKESCLVSTWMVWVMNRANKAAAGLSLPITRCFKSCTRLGVSDRSDAKPAQPADRDRETERESDCMCGTDRMDGWLSVLTVRYKRLTSRVIGGLAYRHYISNATFSFFILLFWQKSYSFTANLIYTSKKSTAFSCTHFNKTHHLSTYLCVDLLYWIFFFPKSGSKFGKFGLNFISCPN